MQVNAAAAMMPDRVVQSSAARLASLHCSYTLWAALNRCVYMAAVSPTH